MQNSNFTDSAQNYPQLKVEQSLIKNPSVPTLFMRLITWHRDSHGLFDYETKQVDQFQYRTTQEGFISRK